MVDLSSLGTHLAKLAWIAFRSFAVTLVLSVVIGLILAVVSAGFLKEYRGYDKLAVVLVLAETLTAGILLGVKQAIAATMLYGVRRLQLGASVVRMLFDRLLGISAAQPHGERDKRIALAAERIPLAQAEQRLNEAVRDVVGSPAAGWFRRRLQKTLLGWAGQLTLARFREEGAKEGGIDLMKVRDDLEVRADNLLASRITHGLRLFSVLLLAGLLTLVVIQTYFLHMVATAK